MRKIIKEVLVLKEMGVDISELEQKAQDAYKLIGDNFDQLGYIATYEEERAS